MLQIVAPTIPIFAIVALVVVLVLCAQALFHRRKPFRPIVVRSPHQVREIEYVRKKLMTETELLFYAKLREALPDAQVAPQVAMSALVDIPAWLSEGKFRHINRAKVAQQRLDYVVFEEQTGAVRHVLELDDRTHDNTERKAKDAERDAILKSVGLSVKRYDARKLPSVSVLRSELGKLR